MRSHHFRVVAAFLALLAGAACSTTPAVTTTNNSVRASDVELVCLEIVGSTVIPHPAARCGLSDTDNSAVAGSGPADAGTAGDAPQVDYTTYHLHAVVPQFDRGEIGVVDLATTTGVALVDNIPAVPGFSFLPVGPFPVSITSDIVEGGGYIYVASANLDRVVRIDASALRSNPTAAGFVAHRREIPVGGLPRDVTVLRSGARVWLVSTLPAASAVSFVDVTDPANPSAPSVVALGAGTTSGDAGVADGGTAVPAHPVSVVADTDGARVFVTDDANPVVHVLDVSDPANRTELAPLAVGVRNRAAAVSGNVRARRYGCDVATDPDHCAATRYLFLTSADDGAVVAWDIGRGARVLPNQLPQPNLRGSRIQPSLRADRVALVSPATALVAINTTLYDPAAQPVAESGTVDETTCSAGYTPVDQSVFSGVFMGVVLRTGQLAILDLDDYNVDAWEAQCRRAAGSTLNGAYRFVRHAPRASTTLATAPALSAPPVVSAVIQGAAHGQTLEGASAPTFACGDSRAQSGSTTCTATNSFGVHLPQRQIGVSAGAPVYGPTDPFTSRNETWTFTFEGLLPGLDQYGGAITADASGGLRVDAPGALFCTRGALARDGVAHDVLSIVSDPTPLAADADLCSRVFGSGTAPLNRDFAVRRAFEDHVLVDVSAEVGDVGLVGRCFPQAVHFQVRAGQQWVAIGGVSGFVHDVRPGADLECEVDPVAQAEVVGWAQRCLVDASLAPTLTSLVCPAARACTGTVGSDGAAHRADAPMFANAYFCTQIYPALALRSSRVVAAPVDRDTLMSFAIANAYDYFRTAVGTLPSAVRHPAGIDRIFVVDSGTNGLMEFRLNPFAAGRIFN